MSSSAVLCYGVVIDGDDIDKIPEYEDGPREYIYDKIVENDLLNQYLDIEKLIYYNQPDFAIVLKKSIFSVEWGWEEINPNKLKVSWGEVNVLLDFLATLGFVDKSPSWILGSYYG